MTISQSQVLQLSNLHALEPLISNPWSFTMPPKPTVPPGLPPPGLSPTPQALLWAYQLTRENKTLTDYLKDVKSQLDDTEAFARNIQKCLSDLVENVTSLAHILGDKAQSDDDKHQLLLLRRQLQHTVGPFCEYGQSLVRKNKKLVECIAALEGLDALSDEISVNVEDPAPFAATPCPKARAGETELSVNVAASPLATPGRPRASVIENKCESTQQLQTETPIDAALKATLATVMEQNGRPLDDYFDAANAFRREQRPLTPNTEKALVTTFIAGCDDKLYRRRLTHALRKSGMTWTWLTHEVQFIVLEEEYMEKQKFALAHQNKDGSVLWPDGSTRRRFVPLPPVTEEDLTSSDGEA